MRILRNVIRCNICNDEIESTHCHDFRTCTCGACSVDGGKDYLRRLYAQEGCYTELSVFETEEVENL